MRPIFTLYVEAQFRTPILARWPAIARFLHAHRDRVAALISPIISAAMREMADIPAARVCARLRHAFPEGVR